MKDKSATEIAQKQTPSELSKDAQIAIYFGVDKMKGLRAVASAVLARYASEYRIHGYWSYMHKAKAIARRWNLQDYYYALCVAGKSQPITPAQHNAFPNGRWS